jgi:MFS family permease
VAYYRFFLTHPRILSFGILLTLFSSFGQTFLISLFVPRLLETFSLNTAQFGSLYAAATLASAASLPFFGRLIDRVPLQRFSLAVGVGLVLSCLAMSLAPNVPILFVAILGLRLTGQGLLSLTASTTMARRFEHGRGRALSLSGLGYPLGEGLLPLLVVVLAHAADWRLSWGIQGGFVALVLLPAMSSLLPKENPIKRTVREDPGVSPRPALFRDWRFYAILPANLFLPLVLTALFLYQALLAGDRDWSAQVMAAAFVGFAVARLAASLIIGPLIDRLCAVRLFPIILLPAAGGLLCLWAGASPLAPFAYLLLAGASQGIAGPMMTSLWAEIYGVTSLGAIKGTVATLAIFATALGPLLVGGLLKAGVAFSLIVLLSAVLALMIAALSIVVRPKLLLSLSHQHGG